MKSKLETKTKQLATKTQQMKDFMKDKTGNESMSIEDSEYSLVFSITDGKIIIGAANLHGDMTLTEIPFTIKED